MLLILLRFKEMSLSFVKHDTSIGNVSKILLASERRVKFVRFLIVDGTRLNLFAVISRSVRFVSRPMNGDITCILQLLIFSVFNL